MKRLALALLLLPTLAGAQRPTRSTDILALLASPFGDTLRALAPALVVLDREPVGVPAKLSAMVTSDRPEAVQFIRHPSEVGLTLQSVLTHEVGHVAFFSDDEHLRAPEFVADIVCVALGREPIFSQERWKYGRDTVGLRETYMERIRYRLGNIIPAPQTQAPR